MLGKRNKLPVINDAERLDCNYCNKSYETPESLRTHMHKSTRKNINLPETGRRKCKRLVFTARKNMRGAINCTRHITTCKLKPEDINVVKDNLRLEKKNGIYKGDQIVKIRIYKNYQLIAIKKKIKAITKRIFTNPIQFKGDVTDLSMWEMIAQDCLNRYGRLYDVVMMDPAWRIKQALPYETISDQQFLDMPINLVQERGILIIWVVNQKRELAQKFIKKHGYEEVDEGMWLKLTKTGKIHCGWGFYTAHCFEKFIIAKKGNVDDIVSYHRAENVIVAPVRQHSQKPEEVYDFVQKMCPDMRNLEVFAKPHNVREGWTSFGNELVEMKQ
ncbi:MT-A70 family protein [Oxytricha trifallax]|uniref:mRNA m(6)A methyltransferase n=1 Tax=Oxytricha trifallax TaxID=1172189 RepID=A0A073HYT7_9SPIT|nr:MT-A70 family protein [Oxytricha trifallax]